MSIKAVGSVKAVGKQIWGFGTQPYQPADGADAGSDQTVLCSSMVILTAAITGGNNNEFLWEQTSGTPVLIDDPTALTTFFLNIGGDDLTFRFWVDKGTAFETFDDVDIIRTPTSWSAAAAAGASLSIDYQKPFRTANDWKYYANQRALTSITFTPDTSSWPPNEDANDGLSCTEITVTTVQVNWVIPEDLYAEGSGTYNDYLLGQYISTVLEKYNSMTSEWEFVAEFVGIDADRFNSIEFDTYYRLGAKYNFGTSPVFIQYTDSFIAVEDVDQLYKIPWSNYGTFSSGSLALRQNSLTRLTAASISTTDESATGGAGLMNIGTFSAKRFTAVIVETESDAATGGAGLMNIGTFTITRSNGGSIGG